MNKLIIILFLIIPLFTFSQESKSERDARLKKVKEVNNNRKTSYRKNICKLCKCGESEYINFYEDLGIAWCENNIGKFGCIDKKGNVVIPFIYDDNWVFTYGNLAFVKRNEKCGFVNQRGIEVIPCIHEEVHDFFPDGVRYFNLSKNGLWGSYDKDGNIVIDFQFQEEYQFSEDGYAVVKKKGKKGIIDKKGTTILNFDYDYISYDDNVNFILVKNNNKWGYININGNELIPIIYDDYFSFFNNIASVSKNGKRFYINKQGECVKDCQ